MQSDSMLFLWPAWVLAGMLAVGLLVAFSIGGYAGRRALSAGRREPIGSLETMASGLLGLLLAFNFNIAQNRFDARQVQVVREANAIGTAYLRCSVLGADARAQCRDGFRQYAKLRIAAYDAFAVGDDGEVVRLLAEGERAQNELWTLVARAVRAEPNPAEALLMSALNSVIDLDAERRASIRIGVPRAVSLVIVFVCAAWASLLGYASGMRQVRSYLARVVVALLISVVFGVALDFDRPRSGFIRTSAADTAMRNLVQSMDAPPED